MSYQPKVYTIGHIMGMTGMFAGCTVFAYAKRNGTESLAWFMETWGIYIGVACTILMFVYGLTILGTPWYDEETNQQLKAAHDRAEFEWRYKSPEERAIIITAKENEFLQLTQILQNNMIIRNQEQMKQNKRN